MTTYNNKKWHRSNLWVISTQKAPCCKTYIFCKVKPLKNKLYKQSTDYKKQDDMLYSSIFAPLLILSSRKDVESGIKQ